MARTPADYTDKLKGRIAQLLKEAEQVIDNYLDQHFIGKPVTIPGERLPAGCLDEVPLQKLREMYPDWQLTANKWHDQRDGDSGSSLTISVKQTPVLSSGACEKS